MWLHQNSGSSWRMIRTMIWLKAGRKTKSLRPVWLTVGLKATYRLLSWRPTTTRGTRKFSEFLSKYEEYSHEGWVKSKRELLEIDPRETFGWGLRLAKKMIFLTTYTDKSR